MQSYFLFSGSHVDPVRVSHLCHFPVFWVDSYHQAMSFRPSHPRDSGPQGNTGSASRFRPGIRDRALPAVPPEFTSSPFFPSSTSPHLDSYQASASAFHTRGFVASSNAYSPPELTRFQSEVKPPVHSAYVTPSDSHLINNVRVSGERTVDGSYMVLQPAEVSRLAQIFTRQSVSLKPELFS